jgi:diguanylate cyclase (GGDEF)-like protein
MSLFAAICIIAIAFFFLCCIGLLLGKIIMRQKKEIHSLRQVTQKDELTQAFTRRYFFEILEYHLKVIQRSNTLSAVLMIDLDNFKEINDTYGHWFGDEVLKHVVSECNRQLRTSDILARYGGDEFILLCPHIEYDDLVMLAKRLQETLRNFQNETITLSMGACLFDKSSSASHIIQYADKALYKAKKNGKDKIEFVLP